MKKWEYKIVEPGRRKVTENDLNSLGEEGWEAFSGASSAQYGGHVIIYMKREILDLPASATPKALQAGPPAEDDNEEARRKV
jgi:hypothetical protein